MAGGSSGVLMLCSEFPFSNPFSGSFSVPFCLFDHRLLDLDCLGLNPVSSPGCSRTHAYLPLFCATGLLPFRTCSAFSSALSLICLSIASAAT